ncbi:hypothetical protein HK105_205317 [Polyrhizophydium stewartii]|uniref:Uncharacterized protein n=1 Tax=Polyrhizophydium stewartii TaxID=2732419 RepID=A0ABR4N6U5_9FUNG|nr:hypothetical protein HK105_002107 [Polyrhizophydium stewartii]
MTWSQRLLAVDGVAQPSTPTLCDAYKVYRLKTLMPRIHHISEQLPLTLFQHALVQMQQALRRFKRCVHSRIRPPHAYVNRPHTLNAFQTFRHERVQEAHQRVLQCLFYIVHALGDTAMSSRAYLKRLTHDERAMLSGTYSERTMFSALALALRFHLRDVDMPSEALVTRAVVLKSAYHALVAVVCARSSACVLPPYTDMVAIARDFDAAWVDFEAMLWEEAHVSQYGGRLPEQHDNTDMFQVLLMETALRAVQHGLLALAAVEAADPVAILAVPRLAIVCGLVHMPECVQLSHTTLGFRWFKRFAREMEGIRASLAGMRPAALRALELKCAGVDDSVIRAGGVSADVFAGLGADADPRACAMCGNIYLAASDDGSETEFASCGGGSSTPETAAAWLHFQSSDEYRAQVAADWPSICDQFRSICALADDLQAGKRAREFSALIGRVFRSFEDSLDAE